ncbi:lipid II:glycine glycyltransferase (peptidoglycan interpeptide bridge formation enzyme) [Leucobacter luti]|uniref:lipid II:glycine glycyltransferase FemX n=1 Tax=Leucobacter luti TaxID=340320 RepID=UPI00104A416F|nr:peptidoglycan bridge formation glycyltransferase FemA/FemB family protein [Leucobacter luti]MCW2287328.1 lipid II:glycine glycyltransferase (peptidoglycan interpeptide bridge formation enzyme) [Leucobacter luti]TCK41551.1 lipid II:glycine glycyltransferase (peptidoglycan interpeptide bridge formation enzyme) [Leucobacter luti]
MTSSAQPSTTLTVTPCTDRERWDASVKELGGHPLQLWGWGELKSAHRWSAERVLVSDASGTTVGACQLLTRTLPGPLGGFVYAPRGPVVARDERDPDLPAAVPAPGEVAEAVATWVHGSRKAVAVSIEPDEDAGTFSLGEKWREAKTLVLPARTLILDLRKSEDELLADMSKKHRQYIRKSGREETMEIRPVETLAQLDECLEVYRETSERADFGLHEDSYYHDAFTMLGDDAPVWAAYVEGKPVAFLYMAKSDRTAFELYGGMDETGQRLRANYALKWHVIRHMKSIGIERYDFGGLINDGVTTFKTGFASHENLLAGSWDRPGPGYKIWTEGLPLAKKIVRTLRRG